MRKIIIILSFLLVINLTGCSDGAKAVSQNRVELYSDGRVEALMVSSFDKTYYDENELLQMVNNEITNYNATHGQGAIEIKDCNLNNSFINLSLIFNSEVDYNNYMPDRIYIGTIKNAWDAGYDFNRSLYIAGKGEATIGKNALMNMADSKVIIVDGLYSVRTPSRILYYSQGMEMIDDYTVQSIKEGNYFIIYK